MLLNHRMSCRRGTVVPLVAISLIALLGCVALAVDLGMFAVSRAQAQNLADAAALAGARAMTWNTTTSTQDISGVYTASTNIVANSNNAVMSTGTSTSTVEIGFYTYNSTGATFPVAPFTPPFNDAGLGTNPDPGFINISPPNSATPAKPTTPIDRTNDNFSMVRVTINYTMPQAFSKVWNLNPFNSSTVATAVHRPRDVAIVLDYSGSMRFGSLLGYPEQNGVRTTSNNPNSVYPKFGHYSDTATADLQGPTSTVSSGGATYAPANVECVPSDGRPAICSQFYSTITSTTTAGVTTYSGNLAFSPVGADGATNYASTNAGDKYLMNNLNTSTTTVADTVNDIVNQSTYHAAFETNGYRGINTSYYNSGAFYRYTRGPGYWGKTFFIWPPDPSTGAVVAKAAGGTTNDTQTTNDWRQRFFKNSGTTTGVTDNTRLWSNSNPWNWRAPAASGGYDIDYAQIMRWLINCGPNPFPTSLRAGRICYYDALPDPDASGETDAAFNTRFRTYQDPAAVASYPLSGADAKIHNEAFWKCYIDYVLGVYQQANGIYNNSYPLINGSSFNAIACTGYGANYAWPSGQNPQISSKPMGLYMSYTDNPLRPRTHMWFGAMTMVDFLANYNLYNLDDFTNYGQRYSWLPGTVSEAPTYQCKLGIRAGLKDIQNNHPNDWVAMVMFSTPKGNQGPTGASALQSVKGGRFNRARSPLSDRYYGRMADALFYPPYTLDNPTHEVRPFDYARCSETPRAMGATAYHHGLMLAYNQLSSNTTTELKGYNTDTGVPSGDAGGLGRKGARKLVIFETDGMPTCVTCSPGTTNNMAIQSSATPGQGKFYPIRWQDGNTSKQEKGDVYPFGGATGTSMTHPIAVINQMATDFGANQARLPFYLHCIAFGPMFDTSITDSATATNRTTAKYALQQMEVAGRVQTGPASSSSPVLADFKIIYAGKTQTVSGVTSTVSLQDQIQQAFTKIMQGGVQVSLIQ